MLLGLLADVRPGLPTIYNDYPERYIRQADDFLRASYPDVVKDKVPTIFGAEGLTADLLLLGGDGISVKYFDIIGVRKFPDSTSYYQRGLAVDAVAHEYLHLTSSLTHEQIYSRAREITADFLSRISPDAAFSRAR